MADIATPLAHQSATFTDQMGQLFDAALHLTSEGKAAGATIAEIRKEVGPHFQIIRVIRGEGLELVRLPELELIAGDKLFVRATAKELDTLADLLGAKLHGVRDEVMDGTEAAPTAANEVLAEVVVMSHSRLNRHTLRELHCADNYRVAVVGLHPRGQAAPSAGATDIGNVELCTGDVLLVQGKPADIDEMRNDAGVLMLNQIFEIPRSRKSWIVLTIMAAVVGLATLDIMKISLAAPLGVFAMLATRCLDWDDLGRALSAKVILLIVASLALGSALTRTGGTDFLAQVIEHATASSGPQVVLIVLMASMAVLTNFVSNAAAAAIGTPIAVSLATRLGVSPEPLVLAILLGANFCFVTPMAYQTNLLVMSAGGYTFSDFVRGGLPLAILLLVIYSILLPIFFPF